MRIIAKKLQKTSIKSKEILVSDLAARAVFGQSPLLEKFVSRRFLRKFYSKFFDIALQKSSGWLLEKKNNFL